MHTQLLGMARYEVIMAWRRRVLPVLLVLLVFAVAGIGLLVRDVNTTSTLDAANQPPPDQLPAWAVGVDLTVAAATFNLHTTIIALMTVVSVAGALLLAETIPLDRQLRVRELIDALPLARVIYLGGKLAGVISGVLLLSLITLVVSAVLLRFLIGAYDVAVFLLLWLVALLPTFMMATALGVLIGGVAGTRRMAVMLALLALPLIMGLTAQGIIGLSAVIEVVHPIYALVLLRDPAYVSVEATVRVVASTLISFGLIVALAFSALWAWNRVRA